MPYKLGIDVGGTYTDLVLVNEVTGQLTVIKTPTPSDALLGGIGNGLSELLTAQGIGPADVTAIAHGTLVVNDGIRNHTGALTGLIVSRGQEELPETGRDAREDYFDINSPAPAPLVARTMRRPLSGEINADGSVQTPLAEAEVARAVDDLVGRGAEAIAVALRNAVVNPAHEQQVGAYIRRQYPHVSVCLSADVTTDHRPYERLTAAVLNAYTQPLTARYVAELAQYLTGLGLTVPVALMTSDGTLTTVETAAQNPVSLLESGPAGSALQSARLSERMEKPNLLSFDMGGTSAQLSLINNGVPLHVDEFEVARVRRFKKGTGLPVAAAAIDLTEIGAGATSLVYVDDAGKLQVGPERVSPEVGPACFGRGGTRPTVADADLVLGYLSETFFRGMALSRGAARRALLEHVALPLEIGVEEAARAIHKLANEAMANAALVHLLEKGYDPRRYGLLASGGAGPIHAFGVARQLGTTDVIIPSGAGVTSALGLLLAPLMSRRSRPHVERISDLDYERANALLADLEQEARSELERSGVTLTEMIVRRTVDLRYRGQQVTATVDLPDGSLSTRTGADLEKAFLANPTTGLQPDEAVLETVTWRVTVTCQPPVVPDRPIVVGSVVGRGDFSALKGYRQVIFMDDDFPVSCPVYDGDRILPGDCLSGPVIIEETETTVVVGRKAYVRMDPYRNLTLTLR